MDGSESNHEHTPHSMGGRLRLGRVFVSVEGTLERVTKLSVWGDIPAKIDVPLLPEDVDHLIGCLQRARPAQPVPDIIKECARMPLNDLAKRRRELKPQTKQVLRYMKRRDIKGNLKTITPMTAMHELGVQSLSRRICDLRDAGYPIKRELKRDFRGKRYATYTLEDERR